MRRFLSLLLIASLAACASPRRSSGFDVTHEMVVKVPPNAQQVRVWFAMPAEDPSQTVTDFKVDSRVPTQTVRDASGENRFVFAELNRPAAGDYKLTTTFHIVRREERGDTSPIRTRPLTHDERTRMAKELAPSTNIVIDDTVRALAADITKGESNPVTASRMIYDWVLQNVEYWVKHPDRMKASTVGSSEYCLKEKCGNCTDFHSLYTALSRAAGIPTRMKYGSFFKGPLDGKDQDQSYHCWVEFWAPDIGWIPIDVAVADLYLADFAIDDNNREKVSLTLADGYHGPDPAMVDYYFGNLDSRRVTWNVGRDLELRPPTGKPVNSMPKAHVLVDGLVYTDWTRKLTFKERK